MNTYQNTNHKRLMDHIIKNKRGKAEALESIASAEEIKDFIMMDYIRIKGQEYSMTKEGINTYNTIYRPPTVSEKFMGLFCHYVLRH